MSNRNSSSLEPKELNELVNCQEDVLKGLFDGHLTTATAAPQLAAVTIPDSNIDSEACEERLQMLWNNVLYFLIREPNRIDTIATLIHCISNLPLPLTEDGKQLAVNEGLRRVWEDKPTLGWELRDEWNGEVTLCRFRFTCYSRRLTITSSRSVRANRHFGTPKHNRPFHRHECTNCNTNGLRRRTLRLSKLHAVDVQRRFRVQCQRRTLTLRMAPENAIYWPLRSLLRLQVMLFVNGTTFLQQGLSLVILVREELCEMGRMGFVEGGGDFGSGGLGR